MQKLNKIYNHNTLNTVIDKYIINLLRHKIPSLPVCDIDSDDLRKAVWLSSILADSSEELHLKKVQDFAILLFLNNLDNLVITKIVYILFSRIGNLTATKFLKELLPDGSFEQSSKFHEDAVLTYELLTKRIDNSVLINGKPYLLTDFQKNLFKSLKEEKHIAISAPTSSGKSFILKKYIEQVFNEYDCFCVLYIVPSRALINQVSEELRTELSNVIIKNAFIENEEIEKKRSIYVITPERAVKIINSDSGMQLPDLIFIDEIQNIENEDGRGNLFEYVYEELSQIDKVKIITAGPYIANPAKIFNDLFNKHCVVVNTELSPVFQLRVIIKLDRNNVSLKLFTSKNNASHTVDNALNIDRIENIFNANIGSGLAAIIGALSAHDDSNLIYSSRSDYAEIWALKYAENIEINNDIEDELKDLIKYVKTEIHSKYYLVSCLEKRVAFHHSSLPEFVRKEIETLFESGLITTLFCTSTLLEGVNLPADNLFVVKPEKNKDELTDFEFGNLIGRAGRLNNSLFGTIYCISKKNNTSWAEKYYQADYTKEVQTFSSKALPLISNDDLSRTGTEIETPKIKNIVTLLRNKALKKDNSLKRFLEKQELDEQKRLNITTRINKSIENITIPYSIIKQNPTIDPLLQDKLYKTIIREGLNNWVIHANSNFNIGYRRNIAEEQPYMERSFFWQLESIVTRLDNVFNIRNEIWKKDNISISTSIVCINAINWIQGKSIGELIANRIKYYSEDDRVKPEKRIDSNNQTAINKEIKMVIKINLSVITFSLLKYLTLLVDILETLLKAEEKDKFKLTLALPIQIELGTQEPTIIFMISNGIPRTIAIKLFDIFKKTDDYKADINVFTWLKTQKYIDGLEPIYNKFLGQNNFIGIENKGSFYSRL